MVFLTISNDWSRRLINLSIVVVLLCAIIGDQFSSLAWAAQVGAACALIVAFFAYRSAMNASPVTDSVRAAESRDLYVASINRHLVQNNDAVEENHPTIASPTEAREIHQLLHSVAELKAELVNYTRAAGRPDVVFFEDADVYFDIDKGIEKLERPKKIKVFTAPDIQQKIWLEDDYTPSKRRQKIPKSKMSVEEMLMAQPKSSRIH
jgi:hypothetical protein